MTRGDKVCAQYQGAIHEEVELQPVVAGEARERRAAAFVFGDKVVDYVPLKLLFEVHVVVPRAYDPANGAGVLHVFEGAARTAEPPSALKRGFEQPHGDADHLVPLARKQQSGDGRIHPAAHGYDDLLLL